MDTVYENVTEEQKVQLLTATETIWETFTNYFNPIESCGEDDKVNTAIDKQSVDDVLQFNDAAENHDAVPNWENKHKFLSFDMLGKLSFLTYDAVPLAPSVAVKPESAGEQPKAKRVTKSDTDILALNDETFLEEFIPGDKDLATNARMQITRLFQHDKPDVTEGRGAVWARFLTIMRNGTVPLPAWVSNMSPTSKTKLMELAQIMADEDSKLEVRWTQEDVTNVEEKIGALGQASVPPQAEVEDITGDGPTRNKGVRAQKRAKSHRCSIPAMVAQGGRSHLPGSSLRFKSETSAPTGNTGSVPPEGKVPVGTASLPKGTVAAINKLAGITSKLDPDKLNNAADHNTNSLNAIHVKLGSMGSDLQKLTSARGSSGSSNDATAEENTRLKHKLSLTKAALKMLLAGNKGSDSGKLLSEAAKGIVSVEGIGFDPKEIEEVFGKSDSTTA